MGRKIKGFVTDRTCKRNVARARHRERLRGVEKIITEVSRERAKCEHLRWANGEDVEEFLADMMANVKLSEGKKEDFWVFGFSFHRKNLLNSPWGIHKTVAVLSARIKEASTQLLYELIKKSHKRNQDQEV